MVTISTPRAGDGDRAARRRKPLGGTAPAVSGQQAARLVPSLLRRPTAEHHSVPCSSPRSPENHSARAQALVVFRRSHRAWRRGGKGGDGTCVAKRQSCPSSNTSSSACWLCDLGHVPRPLWGNGGRGVLLGPPTGLLRGLRDSVCTPAGAEEALPNPGDYYYYCQVETAGRLLCPNSRPWLSSPLLR